MVTMMTKVVQSGCVVYDAYNSSDDDDDGYDDNVDSVDDGSLYLV